tara:strand:- start:110 stop:259 length:150 start_codon:yes stop_codon:yes gene_type:complete
MEAHQLLRVKETQVVTVEAQELLPAAAAAAQELLGLMQPHQLGETVEQE